MFGREDHKYESIIAVFQRLRKEKKRAKTAPWRGFRSQGYLFQ